MSKRYLAVGIFIVAGVALFALGIFLVGSRHEAFSRHLILYTEFTDVNGLTKGSKVRVGGMDAGQVTRIDVPASPRSRFRIQMRINDQLHGLVRKDSIVTIDTEGVVGETFLSIHPGSPDAAIADAGSTLQSKPAVSLSDLLTGGLGIMNDAHTMLNRTSGKLDMALDGVNVAVGNANDLLVGLKEGRGPAGMMLRDQQMTNQIRETMSNVLSTTSNLKQASTRVNGIIGDIQQRQLPQKIDDTMTQIRSASVEANSTIRQVHQGVNQALGPDSTGVTGGENISQALRNVNTASGNMADDTEALKHSLFFRGFFKHRGYYSLSTMSPAAYRQNTFFDKSGKRTWLNADVLFKSGPGNDEELTADGKRQIDDAIAQYGETIFRHPIVIEGYSDATTSNDQLARSYSRAVLVRMYLITRFPFATENIGLMPLSSTPPPGSGHDRWSGICILVPERK